MHQHNNSYLVACQLNKKEEFHQKNPRKSPVIISLPQRLNLATVTLLHRS
jgi:hypothetical protein